MNYYAFFVVLGIIILLYFSKRLLQHVVDHDFFWLLSFYTIIFSLVGAKIFHIIENFLFYKITPQLIFSSYGFSVLGALTFGYITIAVISIIYKAKFIHLTDRIFLVVPIAQFIGRIGNITNQELLPYSFYEMGLNLLNFVVLLAIYKMKKMDGLVTSFFFINYGIIRFGIEYTKGNYLGFLSSVSILFFLFGIYKLLKIKKLL